MNNSKIKKNYRVIFLVTMIVFLLSSIMFVHTLPAFAEEVTVNAYEARLYSNAKINEDFADDSIIIIMDKNSSDVNKFHSFGIARNSQVKITDLTRIDGSADKKKYFNKDEFHQIFKIDLSEHSKENVLNEIHKYENMEGVLWVGPNYYDEPLELPIPLMEQDILIYGGYLIRGVKLNLLGILRWEVKMYELVLLIQVLLIIRI